MTSVERPRRPAAALLVLALSVWLVLAAALLPMLTVITPGIWVGRAALTVGIVLVTGLLSRWARASWWAVSILQAAAWIGAVTALCLPDGARLFVVPTPHTLGLVPDMVDSAAFELWFNEPPVPVSAELGFTLVAVCGLLAVVIDQVVTAARMPLVAAAALVAVSIVPSLVVPTAYSLVSFLVLAAAVLLLLYAETRARPRLRAVRGRASERTAGVALAIGLVVVLATAVITPLVPEPTARVGFGTGTTTIDASLDLGNDLRRPNPSTVLTLETTADSAPYLRVATLTSFDGSVWHPDSYSTRPLSEVASLPNPQTKPEIDTITTTTELRIDRLASRYLPVPYAAVSFDGAVDGWHVMDSNRTVVSPNKHTSSGQEYRVDAAVPQPTLKQMESAVARGTRPEHEHLPDDVPETIRRAAAQVTAGTSSDYDALLALQRWFRGPDFDYSLTAPKTEGFDDSGMASVAAFLQVKEGYCIHFASAFAIMARLLDMPSRIVVGYLPGHADSSAESGDGSTTYTVSSTQLHAWPEVYFSGVGWVRFDPTKSLGVPTDFGATASETTEEDRASDAPSTEPSAEPTPIETAEATDAAEQPAAPVAPGESRPLALGLLWLVGLVIALVLLLPAAAGAVRRRRLRSRAARDDASAAWALVYDTAVDLAVPVSRAESPRALGERLVRDGLARESTIAELVHAVEVRSYAPPGTAVPAMARSADAVCADLRRSSSRPRRVLALVLPRSVFRRALGWAAGSGIRSPQA